MPLPYTYADLAADPKSVIITAGNLDSSLYIVRDPTPTRVSHILYRCATADVYAGDISLHGCPYSSVENEVYNTETKAIVEADGFIPLSKHSGDAAQFTVVNSSVGMIAMNYFSDLLPFSAIFFRLSAVHTQDICVTLIAHQIKGC